MNAPSSRVKSIEKAPCTAGRSTYEFVPASETYRVISTARALNSEPEGLRRVMCALLDAAILMWAVLEGPGSFAVSMISQWCVCWSATSGRELDGRVGEVEVVDVLGQSSDLVFDQVGLFLGDLRLQQVADYAGRLMLALDERIHDLVIGAAHAEELQRAHYVEDLGSLVRARRTPHLSSA